MATLINNAGVQHYANKMVLAENRKVGSKSLPTALTDIDNLIDEMKTQFDAEYGSALDMKLSNNENTFSVGAGTDIDKRSEVENGFTDVELSGNSLVNCVLIDKLYEDSNYLEYENSPVITESNITLKSKELNHVRFCPKIECGVIKPNTKYTLIFNVTSNNLTGRTNLTHTNTDTLISAFPFTNTIQPKQTGIFKYVLTSIADISSCNTLLRTIIWNDCSTEGETITFSLMILEGDWTNKPIPQYFEGMKSVGEKEDGNHKISISSMGKNLCPITEYKIYNVPINQNMNGYRDTIIARNIRVKPNTTYAIYFKDIIGASSNTALKVMTFRDRIAETGLTHVDCYTHPNRIREYNISRNRFNATITTESDANYINVTTGGFIAESSTITYVDLQIVEGSTVDSIDSYKEDKKEILLNEPLRAIPNGIKDTIE